MLWVTQTIPAVPGVMQLTGAEHRIYSVEVFNLFCQKNVCTQEFDVRGKLEYLWYKKRSRLIYISYSTISHCKDCFLFLYEEYTGRSKFYL